MKKALALLLSLVMCLSLVACGGGNAEETAQHGTSDESYKLGDTVSTDIFEFTLDEATFTYALNNVSGENYFTPKEYNAENDNDNPYVADTGKTLIAITYTITNTGRTSTEFYRGGFFTVKYDGKKYPAIGVLGLEEGACYHYEDFTYLGSNGKQQTEEAGRWYKNQSDNILVDAGTTDSHRAYTEINVDVEELTDGFTITVEIPNSKGKAEKFTYSIG